MGFLNIVYHVRVSWAADVYKIEFGSIPNLNNHGHVFINFDVCCNISEKNVVILFICGTEIMYYTLLRIII